MATRRGPTVDDSTTNPSSSAPMGLWCGAPDAWGSRGPREELRKMSKTRLWTLFAVIVGLLAMGMIAIGCGDDDGAATARAHPSGSREHRRPRADRGRHADRRLRHPLPAVRAGRPARVRGLRHRPDQRGRREDGRRDADRGRPVRPDPDRRRRPVRPLDLGDHDHAGEGEPGRLLRSVLHLLAGPAGPGGRRHRQHRRPLGRDRRRRGRHDRRDLRQRQLGRQRGPGLPLGRRCVQRARRPARSKR